MTDGGWRHGPGKGARRPAILRRRGEERLLEAAKGSPRALALYLLAVRVGLGARECAGLDVEDVSADGRLARKAVQVRTTDRRRSRDNTPKEFAIDAETSRAIEAYLGCRQERCPHFLLRFRTVVDDKGTERCHACQEVVPFLKGPLFLGRRGRRVVPHWLREEFRGLGRRLRLPVGVRFASLGQRLLADGSLSRRAIPINAARSLAETGGASGGLGGASPDETVAEQPSVPTTTAPHRARS